MMTMMMAGTWDPVVKASLVKIASICLCSNVIGQLAMGLVVHPPKLGEPSYDLWKSEKDRILESLRTRADRLAGALDALPGVTCAPAEGALYLFPRIELPIKAIAAARAAGVAPDEFYALKLLDATGLVVVPGSGFGQPDPYAFHFRTTFLPPAEQLETVCSQMTDFHTAFLREYSKFNDYATAPATPPPAPPPTAAAPEAAAPEAAASEAGAATAVA